MIPPQMSVLISLLCDILIPLQIQSCDFACNVLSLHVISLGSNVIFDPLHNSCCDFDMQKNSELAKFNSILEFMSRVPIQKALTDQRPVYKSDIKRFWKHATYDETNKVIKSVVKH
ncbi:hypothetical protein Hdeb2414_s0002g00063121 [Helianthus debilis subsp. tardiflorus]